MRIRYIGIEIIWRSARSVAFGSPAPDWVALPKTRKTKNVTDRSKPRITAIASSLKVVMA